MKLMKLILTLLVLTCAPGCTSNGGKTSGPPPPPRPKTVTPAPQSGPLSIATVYAGKDKLANQRITVQGTVVKVNNDILGRNWVHLEDGTGVTELGSNDLTVTTRETVTKGSRVTFTGTLALNRDFGSGYSYPVLLEDAAIGSSATAPVSRKPAVHSSRGAPPALIPPGDQTLPPGHPPIGSAPTQHAHPPQRPPAGGPRQIEGTVVDVLAGGSKYVYLKLKTPGGIQWSAVPKANIAIGQSVRINTQLEMKNYTSPSLKRTFEHVWFGTLVKR